MRARGETVGALNLFRSAVGPIDAQDVPLAQGMADMAALSLLQERSLREARSVVTQLQGALSSRVVLEQAKGVLAERVGIDVAEAFTRMRDHARATSTPLSDVARDLVEGRLSLEAMRHQADR
jgi:AmiR/NasT family two-component response regulator